MCRPEHRKVVHLLVLVVLFLMVSIRTAYAEAAGATEMVHRYSQAVDYADRLAFEFHSKGGFWIDGKLQPRKARTNGKEVDTDGTVEVEGLFRRDGNRLDLIVLTPGTSRDRQTDPLQQTMRGIIDNGLWLRLGADGDRKAAYVCEEKTRTDVTPHQLVVEQASLLLGGTPAIDGILRCQPDKLLPQIFLDASDTHLRPQAEDVDGHATQVLECTEGNYTYTAWIDPAAGYHPRRIWARHSGGEGWDLTIDIQSFAMVNGRPIPDKAHVVNAYTSSKGRQTEVRTDCRRWNINLSPDFAAMGAFKMVAPDDYRVENHNAQGLMRWKLKDGQVVPYVDTTVTASVDRMLADAKRLKDAPPPTAANSSIPIPQEEPAGRVWIWESLVAVVAVAASLTLIWQHRRRSTSSSQS